MRLQLPEPFSYINLSDHIFFISRGSTKSSGKARGLFSDFITEVFLFFYQYALQSFVSFKKYLQKEEPLLSRLHDQIQQLLKRISCKFLQIGFVGNEDMFSGEWRKQENQKSGSFDLWYFFLIFFDVVFFRNVQYNHLGSFTLFFCLRWMHG